jgi:hypothetical protein
MGRKVRKKNVIFGSFVHENGEKGKVCSLHAMKSNRVSRDIIPIMRDLGTS